MPVKGSLVGDFSGDGAMYLKVGVRVKPDLLEAFHERRTHEFSGNPGALHSPRKKIEFVIGRDAVSFLLALFSLFLVDILSRSQFLPNPPPYLAISVQIWTNYETHIFEKWGRPT